MPPSVRHELTVRIRNHITMRVPIEGRDRNEPVIADLPGNVAA
jgi:hypothetical protein